MALHVFLRTFSLFSNGRILTNRTGRINLDPAKMFLKSDSVDRLRQLNVPSKPKKPMSPFLRFVKENHATVAKENPTLKQSEVIKKCAENWKTVGEELKEKYHDIYKSESEEYDKKLLSYMASLTEEQRYVLKSLDSEKREDRKKRKLRKLCKENDKPKRPVPSYMRYLMEQSKMKNVPMNEIMISHKGQWAHMSLSEKKKYDDAYKKEKEEYDIALNEWERRMIKDGHKELVRAKTLEMERPSKIKQLKKDNQQ